MWIAGSNDEILWCCTFQGQSTLLRTSTATSRSTLRFRLAITSSSLCSLTAKHGTTTITPFHRYQKPLTDFKIVHNLAALEVHTGVLDSARESIQFRVAPALRHLNSSFFPTVLGLFWTGSRMPRHLSSAFKSCHSTCSDIYREWFQALPFCISNFLKLQKRNTSRTTAPLNTCGRRMRRR